MSDKKLVREKNPCKGVVFTEETHKEFSVTTIPFQNLHKDHTLRVKWQKENPDKDWKDDKGREGIDMRPASKDLEGHKRPEVLSYAKLVRETARQMHKDGKTDDVTNGIARLNGRVFQNLIAVIGVDDKTFSESWDSVTEVVKMFITDVTKETPHAKPSAGGGKSRAEIEAELKEEEKEKRAALRHEALAYVQRAASKQGINGVPFPAVDMDTLFSVYIEVRGKFETTEGKDAKEALETLEGWASGLRQMGVFPTDESPTDHDTLEEV